MKAVAATEMLLLIAVLAALYLVWMQQGELQLAQDDIETLRLQVSDLAKPRPRAPRAARTSKPKEPSK